MTGFPRRFETIVILTGAGLSAASGLDTFRDKGGIWARYDWKDVATPEGFARNPALVHEFYNMRRRTHQGVKPNAAHLALARLEREHGGVRIVTQNVDALHEAAGSRQLIHMHGEALKALCAACGSTHHWTDDLSQDTACPACRMPGRMRPDVVWFGEIPYRMAEIGDHLARADLFIAIGTSGHVYPAADFVVIARQAGAHTVELNLEPSEGAKNFAESHYGPAVDVVPDYVERLLAGRAD